MTFWKLLRRKLRSLRRLSVLDLALIFYAALCVPAVSIALKVFGFRRCAGRVNRRYCSSKESASVSDDWGRAARVARLVEIAARNSIWKRNCLRTSLLLAYFLRKKGIPAGLQIGVRPPGKGDLIAHAWVEWDGHVLNDVPHVAEIYTPFSNLNDAVSPPRC
ncbi:MAG: lasso peptide biosynthesis B2 protein [Planctomycetaceae bacterium]|nr:lasso peptide biosynthesis B2 protein [Planctomycetaceae bacterium]